MSAVSQLPQTAENGTIYLVGNNRLYIYFGEWYDAGDFSIEGPQGPVGPEGPQGQAGTDGTKIYIGTLEPQNVGDYVKGDLYLNIMNGNLYNFDDRWILKGSLKGPQGIQGPRGLEGPQGPVGPEGPQGPVGPQGSKFEINGPVADTTYLPSPETVSNNTAYLVGSSAPYALYVVSEGRWVNVGTFATLDNIQTVIIDAPDTATSGTLSSQQLSLVSESDVVIQLGNDIYHKTEDQSGDGYWVFSSFNNENVKTITIMTAGSWTKNVYPLDGWTAASTSFDDVGRIYVSGDDVQEAIDSVDRGMNILHTEKANKDGYYAQMRVGLADNLESPDGITDNALFNFRPSGGNKDISTGFAEIKKVKGKTLVVNQLIKNGNFATSEEWRITPTEATATFETNKLTIKTTRTGGDWTAIYQYINGLQLNNRYFLKIKNTKSSNCALRLRYPQILTISDNTEYIITANEISEGSLFFQVQSTDGQEATLELTEIAFVDQTKMFGAGEEPATVAEFNNLTRNVNTDPYNEGTLISPRFELLISTGFNSFDGELEQGGIDGSGGKYNSQTDLRSKNFIKVVCGGTYTWSEQTRTGWNNRYLHCYDKNYEFIGVISFGNNANAFISKTLKDNCAYVKLHYYSSSSPLSISSIEQICFHLTHSGYRNGQYEPHWEEELSVDTIPYFQSGMKSAGSAYDELTKEKSINRIVAVDLGSLYCTISSAGGANERITLFDSSIVNMAVVASNQIANVLCADYTTASGDDVYLHRRDKTISGGKVVGVNGFFEIYDSALIGKTAEEVKSILSGKIAYYELAEPLETDINIENEWFYRVDDFGTESADDTLANLEIFYMNNLRDKLRRLPNIPECPPTGTHTLKCINGECIWEED